MKNPLKEFSYKRKYSKAAGQLVDALAEKDKLQKENQELRYRNISLELEVKRQMEIAENTREAATLIEVRNRQLEAKNKSLREENIKLMFGSNFLEHKEVMNSEHRTQSNGRRA